MKVYYEVGKQRGQRATVVYTVGKVLEGAAVSHTMPIPEDADLYICWGHRNTEDMYEAFARGTVIVCLDRGYFDATRFQRFSISIQGVHGLSMPVDGTLALPPRQHPELQPWKTGGEYVQIAAPGWSDTHWRTPSARLPLSWMDDLVADAGRAFDKPVKIHWHPRACPEEMRGAPPLEDTFDETYVSVVYQSLSAVQTVVAGVPSVALHKRCIAWPVAASTFERITPEREAWLHDLSHREYAMADDAEMALAAEYIMRGYWQAKERGPITGDWLEHGIREPI